MSDPAASSEDWLVNLTSYLKTRKGLILAAEIIISFIIFICYAASWFGGYIAGSISEMIFALVIFVVFMMQWDKEFLAVNWLWTDFLRAFIGAWVYMITSLIVISRRHMDHAGVAGGVFGLIAGFLFAYDTYTICLQIKASRQKAAPPTVCSAGEIF
ncbi:proteolipid protein 2-like [Cololabis saira]|uniref:proteolipid protein 2-like n=1 Tax=Cololabis saira TaxID=129043 RepID=UPI002AD3E51B|nr:proteolipid protein 2-like [Cololabis saira]